MRLPPGFLGNARHISAQPNTEDRKLRKDLALEVLALKVPFRNRYSFWESASESSPVGRDDCAVQISQITRLNLRCQTRTRVAEKRPASHTNALGSLFITEERKACKWEILKGKGRVY
jgi:hypothetical protein